MDLTNVADPCNEVQVKWKPSDGHADLERHKQNKYSYPIIIIKELTLQRIFTFFFKVVIENEDKYNGHKTGTETS